MHGLCGIAVRIVEDKGRIVVVEQRLRLVVDPIPFYGSKLLEPQVFDRKLLVAEYAVITEVVVFQQNTVVVAFRVRPTEEG